MPFFCIHPAEAQSIFRIIRFVWSISAALREVRYIWVVCSESCPMLSLMIAKGTWRLLARLAQLWRALYNADIFVEINAIKIIDNNEYQ